MDLDTAIADELTPSPALAHLALQTLRDAHERERTARSNLAQTQANLLTLIGDIRAALGVGGKPMLFDLPGICRELRERAGAGA